MTEAAVAGREAETKARAGLEIEGAWSRRDKLSEDRAMASDVDWAELDTMIGSGRDWELERIAPAWGGLEIVIEAVGRGFASVALLTTDRDMVTEGLGEGESEPVLEDLEITTDALEDEEVSEEA